MRELDSVVLTVDLPEHGLQVGDIGTVVLVHGDGAGYEIELSTLDGETVAVVTLLASQVHFGQKHQFLLLTRQSGLVVIEWTLVRSLGLDIVA